MSCPKSHMWKNAKFKPLNGCEARGMRSGVISRRTEPSQRSLCGQMWKAETRATFWILSQGWWFISWEEFDVRTHWAPLLKWDFSTLKDPAFHGWCLMPSSSSQGQRWSMASLLLGQCSVHPSGTKSVTVSKKPELSWFHTERSMINLGSKTKLYFSS